MSEPTPSLYATVMTQSTIRSQLVTRMAGPVPSTVDTELRLAAPVSIVLDGVRRSQNLRCRFRNGRDFGKQLRLS